MSFLRDIVEGTARKELKARVDEILEANKEFCRSIDRLSGFFESLSDGGDNSRLLTVLAGLKEDLSKGLTDLRADEEKLIETLRGRHWRSIDKLLKYLDKNL